MKESVSEHINCDLIRIYNLLGKEWSLPILHSFMEDESQSYGMIKKRFRRINPTLLSKRLRSFSDFGMIRKDDTAYRITRFGKKFFEIIHKLKKEAIRYNLSLPDGCKKGRCICSRPE